MADGSRWLLIGKWIAGVLAAIIAGVAIWSFTHDGGILNKKPKQPSIYRVRVTVIDTQNTPVDNARVWSTFGGEPKRVAGGWQFDIPSASVSKNNKRMPIYAKSGTFLRGQATLILGADPNPSLIIQLKKSTSATVRGIVVDTIGRAIPEAKVSVVGSGDEAATTDESGNFVLPAHAAVGERVRLHVEADGYKPENQHHFAGTEPATIILPKD